MGPFTIREATSSDVDGIGNLDTHVTGLTHDRERVLVDAAIAAHECLVCIGDSGDVIGYIALTAKTFFGRDFVRLLEVSERHRRRGVATALLVDALARCTTDTVFTSTNESNAAMRALLTRDGWTLSGALTGIDDGDPELVFWKLRVRV